LHAAYGLRKQVMLQQLAIAADLGRVTTLHCVGAFGRMLSALQQRPRQQQRQQQPQQQGSSQHSTTAALLPPVVLHSFNGDASLVPALAAENCYFSFSGRGIITNAASSTIASSQLQVKPIHHTVVIMHITYDELCSSTG
jgi:Tat protein secretion system quality control protein TatD with DNase activity